MLRALVGIGLAATAAASLSTAATAQSWNFNYRQDQLEHRIDMGVRDGSLTRFEAMRLRNQLNRISWLQQRYDRDGMSWSERRDLDRRFDQLSQQIRFERHDDQDRFNNGDRWLQYHRWNRGW